jgi:hypothetical protein
MQTITTIGLDIAKSVFQVHGVDAAGEVVIRRQLKRRSVLAFFQKLSPCLVGNRRFLVRKSVTPLEMAEHILQQAASGERDLNRLKSSAFERLSAAA